MSKRRAVLVALGSAVVGLAVVLPSGAAPGAGADTVDFVVDNPGDDVDTAPGDGVCAAAVVPPPSTTTTSSTVPPAPGVCTLRAAVQEANALPGHQVIMLPAAVRPVLVRRSASEDRAFAGDLDVRDDLTIVGESGSRVDGAQVDRVFHVIGEGVSLELSSVSVKSGRPNGGRPLGRGGNILAGPGTSLTITGGSVYYGQATRGGGIAADGDVTLVDVKVHTNRATNGGGLWVSGALSVTGGMIDYNAVSGAAGGLVALGPTTSLSGTEVSANSADVLVGGMAVTGEVTLDSAKMWDNGAGQAAGIYAFGSGSLAITDSELAVNEATQPGGLGGALLTEIPTTVDYTSFLANSAGLGGGVLAFAPITVTDSAFIWNKSQVGVAALGVAGADSSVANSTFEWNDTLGSGGAIGVGGALHLDSVTIVENSAAVGAGIYTMIPGEQGLAGGTVTVVNSIVANQRAGGDCGGVLPVSEGHNLESGVSCGFSAVGDLQGTDPLLLVYVSATMPAVRPPLDGSPVIDAGDTTLTADARGVPRPQGDADDIGAVEVEQPVGAVAERGGDTAAQQSDPPQPGGSGPVATRDEGATVSPPVTRALRWREFRARW